MAISNLQKARYSYNPKLPGMLRNGISEICVKDGAPTESVADQEKIKALFPNTYGKNEITFQKGANTSAPKKQVVGVILSGGQAPGGHNVICGLYDALKATDKDNVLLGFKGGPSGLIDDDHRPVQEHRRIRYHRLRQNQTRDRSAVRDRSRELQEARCHRDRDHRRRRLQHERSSPC